MRALCLFRANDVLAADDPEAVLNESARFLPVNPLTGGLIRTGQE